MSQLAGVSDEALSKIMELSSLDLVHLWLAGNANFNRRIERSCLFIYTSSDLQERKLKRWPRMFSRLTALQVLNIDVRSVSEPVAAISSQVRLLSPSLLTLNLSFWCANSILLNDASTAFIIGRDREYRKSMVGSNLWNVSTHFPRLKEVTFWNSGLHTGSPLICADSASFAIFPASLQKLAWNAMLHDQTTFYELPQDLLSLHVEDGWSDASASHTSIAGFSFPPNLTHLEGFEARGASALAALPRTLKTGDWFNPVFVQSLLTPEVLAALPPATLAINDFFILKPDAFTKIGVSWPTALPKSLTRLQSPAPLNAEVLSLLPRTIRFLEESPIELDDLSNLAQVQGIEKLYSLWPSELESLELTTTPSFVPTEHMRLLPRTLRSLNIPKLKEDALLLDAINDLPPRLSSLTAVHFYTSIAPICSFPPGLPRGLLHLDLNVKFDPTSLHHLPQSLETLLLPYTCLVTPDRDEAACQLPPGLKTLDLNQIHLKSFPGLPSSLTYLRAEEFVGGSLEEAQSILPRAEVLAHPPWEDEGCEWPDIT